MGGFDRFTPESPAEWRLAAALGLSLTAGLGTLLGASGSLTTLVVGCFMLAVPGLLLVELLAVRDGLLALVLGMMAGPVLWVVLPVTEVFLGAWHPEGTVVVVAGLLAVAAGILLARRIQPAATAGRAPVPAPPRRAAGRSS